MASVSASASASASERSFHSDAETASSDTEMSDSEGWLSESDLAREAATAFGDPPRRPKRKQPAPGSDLDSDSDSDSDTGGEATASCPAPRKRARVTRTRSKAKTKAKTKVKAKKNQEANLPAETFQEHVARWECIPSERVEMEPCCRQTLRAVPRTLWQASTLLQKLCPPELYEAKETEHSEDGVGTMDSDSDSEDEVGCTGRPDCNCTPVVKGLLNPNLQHLVSTVVTTKRLKAGMPANAVHLLRFYMLWDDVMLDHWRREAWTWASDGDEPHSVMTPEELASHLQTLTALVATGQLSAEQAAYITAWWTPESLNSNTHAWSRQVPRRGRGQSGESMLTPRTVWLVLSAIVHDASDLRKILETLRGRNTPFRVLVAALLSPEAAAFPWPDKLQTLCVLDYIRAQRELTGYYDVAPDPHDAIESEQLEQFEPLHNSLKHAILCSTSAARFITHTSKGLLAENLQALQRTPGGNVLLLLLSGHVNASEYGWNSPYAAMETLSAPLVRQMMMLSPAFLVQMLTKNRAYQHMLWKGMATSPLFGAHPRTGRLVLQTPQGMDTDMDREVFCLTMMARLLQIHYRYQSAEHVVLADAELEEGVSTSDKTPASCGDTAHVEEMMLALIGTRNGEAMLRSMAYLRTEQAKEHFHLARNLPHRCLEELKDIRFLTLAVAQRLCSLPRAQGVSWAQQLKSSGWACEWSLTAWYAVYHVGRQDILTACGFSVEGSWPAQGDFDRLRLLLCDVYAACTRLADPTAFFTWLHTDCWHDLLASQPAVLQCLVPALKLYAPGYLPIVQKHWQRVHSAATARALWNRSGAGVH